MKLVLEYPKCSTCKKAKNWTVDHGYEVEFRDIVKDNPTVAELTEWINRSDLPLKRFFNTSGILYKEMNLKEKLNSMTQEEMIELLASNGMLVKRPLLITDKGIHPGFKESEWITILD